MGRPRPWPAAMPRRAPARAPPQATTGGGGWPPAGPRALRRAACLAGAALLAVSRLVPAALVAVAHRASPPRAAPRPRAGRPGVAARAFDIGGALQGLLGDEEFDFEVPTTSEAVVNGLKESTENTLNQGISRLDVECPPGFVFGAEDRSQGKLLEDDLDPRNAVEVRKSNRELARIFVEMLQPIGEGLVVAFATKKDAGAAKKKWKLTKDEAKVVSFPGNDASTFAAEVDAPRKFKARLRKLNCQCLLVVAPRVPELRLVAEISREVQDQMGIVLLNARIHGDGRRRAKPIPSALLGELQSTFVPTYHARFLEQRKNAVLFRMNGPEGMQVPWILSQQRELMGNSMSADEVARFSREPTPEEVEMAFEAFARREKDLGDKVVDMLERK